MDMDYSRALFNTLRIALQEYVSKDLKIAIPSEFLAIDNETAIMFLRMKVRPIYNNPNELGQVAAHIKAAEQLYPDITSKINETQRAKLFKYLEAMLALV